MTTEKNINVSSIEPAARRAVAGGDSRPTADRDAKSRRLVEGEKLKWEEGRSEFIEEQLKFMVAHRKGLEQDIKERKKYAQWTFWVVVAWLSAALLIIVSSGLGWLKLPGYVLAALVSGVSVGFVGGFVAIVGYLFKRN